MKPDVANLRWLGSLRIPVDHLDRGRQPLDHLLIGELIPIDVAQRAIVQLVLVNTML